MVFATLLLFITVFSLGTLGFFDIQQLSRGISNIITFTSYLYPPDFQIIYEILPALLETIQIAFLGTVIGFHIALPLAILSARNMFSLYISTVVRFLLNVIRTIPSLLWAIIFVVAFGLGPLPGVIAISAYSTGYLGKLFYELFEGVDPEILDAHRAIGISKFDEIRYVLIPESVNGLLSQVLFMFEYNVRASTILGFVGAGGIGFYLLGYIQLFQYKKLFALIIITLIVVLIIDFVSEQLRKKFTVKKD